jgi:oligoribonuclease
MKEKKQGKLVWLDLEFSGLCEEKDVILEIASAITDNNLKIISIGPEIAIRQSQEIISSMDEWNTKTHTHSGLIERVLNSSETHSSAEVKTLQFIKKYVAKSESPMCGNSIHVDRRFIRAYMPELDEYLHYRNIDVSTVKELVKRWYPNSLEYKKKNTHIAREDILESINELRHYRSQIFKPKK